MLLEGLYVEVKRLQGYPLSSLQGQIQGVFAVADTIHEHREQGE